MAFGQRKGITVFQYMLLLRGATSAISASGSASNTFQYMLLLRGATRRGEYTVREECFNTCSSCEEQRTGATTVPAMIPFQYMLLLRGATSMSANLKSYLAVSIHAPLARSNSYAQFRGAPNSCFNTCSSCEEQLVVFRVIVLQHVSIHAPLARSNVSTLFANRFEEVSIHAPLARSNFLFLVYINDIEQVSIHAPLARSNARKGNRRP